MTRRIRVALAVLGAIAAVLAWFVLTYGFMAFAAMAFNLDRLSGEARTALTIGALAVTLAGAIAAGGACFFLIADEPEHA